MSVYALLYLPGGDRVPVAQTASLTVSRTDEGPVSVRLGEEQWLELDPDAAGELVAALLGVLPGARAVAGVLETEQP